jgi:hypothetical protein
VKAIIRKTTDYFYKEIAKPFRRRANEILFAYFDIRKCGSPYDEDKGTIRSGCPQITFSLNIYSNCLLQNGSIHLTKLL